METIRYWMGKNTAWHAPNEWETPWKNLRQIIWQCAQFWPLYKCLKFQNWVILVKIDDLFFWHRIQTQKYHKYTSLLPRWSEY